MLVIKSDVTAFFDVDNTLIKWSPKSRHWAPHKVHIRILKKFYTRKQPVIVWSAGGYKHALRMVKALKLEKYVTAVMAKPRWWADDDVADNVLPAHNRMFFQDDKE